MALTIHSEELQNLSERKGDSSFNNSLLGSISRDEGIISPIFQHQQIIDNQIVQQLIRKGIIQTKLTVNQPGDIYEQEADRVAEQVMRMSAEHYDFMSPNMNDEIINRKCQSCQEEEEMNINISRKPMEGNKSEISENVEQHVDDILHTKVNS